MKEIWKDIEGYGGYYQVSNYGVIRSFNLANTDSKRCVPKYIKPTTNGAGKGYLIVNFRHKGIRKSFLVHRLVAITFIDNPKNKPQVNHIDGDVKNNLVSNLEWVTSKENVQHAIRTGLISDHKRPKGEDAGNSKLKECQVLEIRELLTSNTIKRVAEIFEVSVGAIENIKYQKTWKHI